MKILSLIAILLFSVSNAFGLEIAPEPSSGFAKKTVLTAESYMVVSAHQLASEAGKRIIKQGGNAIDAAIATEMVLNLVEPQASGIGGGGFLVYYDKKTHQTKTFDGRETAPSLARADMFLNADGKPVPYLEALKGGLGVGVPGLLKMFALAHKNEGKLAWKDLFTPAIELAENGFPLSPRLYEVIKSTPYIINSKEAKDLYFTKDSQIKAVGTIIKNKEFALTLRKIADKGVDAFYRGDIANAIVEIIHKNSFKPGTMVAKDLIDYRPKENEALCGNYRDYKICGMGLPSSGTIAILEALKTIENIDLKNYLANSLTPVHFIMEALRLAFADRNKYVADCEFASVPIDAMLDADYIKARQKLISKDKALTIVPAGEIKGQNSCGVINIVNEHPSTTHLSIVDKEGNAVSMTNSIEYSFGSALMVKGFFLNNQLTDFSSVPQINGVKVANSLEPGKRSRSSMSPLLVFDKNDKLFLVIGSPGGSRIISYVLQTLIAVLDWNIELDNAINQPHYATTGDEIELEKNTRITELSVSLQNLGHKVIVNDLTSGLHGILIQNGQLISGVDGRREGAAAGE